MDIFNYIRDNMSKIGTTSAASGRRALLQSSSSNQPLPSQVLAAFIKSGLQSPTLQGALGDLTPIFSDIDNIASLAVDTYFAIKDLAQQVDSMGVVMNNYHPESPTAPPSVTEPLTIGGFTNSSVQVRGLLERPTSAST